MLVGAEAVVVVVIVRNRSENICFCARMSLSVWNHDIDTKGRQEERDTVTHGEMKKEKTSRQRYASQISGCTDWSDDATPPPRNPPPTSLPLLSSGTDQRNKASLHCSHTLGLEGNSVPALIQHNHTHKCKRAHTQTMQTTTCHTFQLHTSAENTQTL